MASEGSTRRVAKLVAHVGSGGVDADAAAGVEDVKVEPCAVDFRYTLPNGVLTEAQRAFYEENGFIVISDLVTDKELATYHERYENICSGKVGHDRLLTVMKDVAICKEAVTSGDRVTKLQNYENDEVLFSYCQTPGIVKYVTAFCGDDVKSVHTMLINKPPDAGAGTSRHPLHQDLHYFPFRPADRMVCAWTAMERVHRDNGCLVVVKGSHRWDRLMEHGYPQWEGGVNKAYHGIVDFDKSWELTYLEMKKGDTVFFHPLLIHGSGSNRTKGFRKAISCHYASSHCYYIDVRGTTQEHIAEEIEEMGRRMVASRGGRPLAYQDLWRYKSRLVSGVEDTL